MGTTRGTGAMSRRDPPPPEPVARWVLSLAVAVNFGFAAVAAVMIIVVPDIHPVLRVMAGLSAVVLTWVGWRRLRTTPNR